MPELPEVETVRRGLENHLTGRRIERIELRRPDLRFSFPEGFAALLRGRRVESVERRAKYLLIRLDGDATWMCHLGMTGRWTLLGADSSEAADGPHDWVVVHLDDGRRAVFSDHRRFGFMDHFETSEQNRNRILAKLGPEPTPDHLTPMDMADALRGRRTPMKAALLDQRTVAGLGNIYVCEILFRSGISPRRNASSVAGKSGVTKRVERVTAATHDVIVRRLTPEARASATSSTSKATWATSVTPSRSTVGRASPAFQRDVRPPSGVSSSQAARPSTVQTASVELTLLFL